MDKQLSMEQPILIEYRDRFAIVTLNRPDSLNALSRGLLAAFSAAVDTLEADPAIRAIILTGAGRAFCAGMDLKELSDPTGPLAAEGGLWSEESINPVKCLERFSGPIVAAVNGAAVTGGFEIALACDLIVASKNARFADTHGRVGVVPGGGVSQLLSRAIGIYRAKEFSLTGNFLTAERACEWGLVNMVVEHDDLLAAAIKYVTDMLGLEHDMLITYKNLIDDGFKLSLNDALALEEEIARSQSSRTDATGIALRRQAVIGRGRTQARTD